MKRLVLDTNTVISALLWGGSPKSLLTVIQARKAGLFTSHPLIEELTDVLTRRKFHRQITASQLSIGQLLDIYALSTTQVIPVHIPRIAPDPDDDVVIGTAIAAKADLIVTGDRALLSVAEFEGIRIVSVVEALRILGAG